MTIPPISNIVIVGAGIGGLVHAICLRRKGFNVRILEQALQLTDYGAGIQLQPNAMKVLNTLGLREAIAAVAVEPSSGTLRRAATGKIIINFNHSNSEDSSNNNDYYQIHRADLLTLLVEQCKQLDISIHLNTKVVGLSHLTSQVEVITTHNEKFIGDIVIGADGVKSTIRQQLFNDDTNNKPQFTGHVAYRGLIDASKLSRPVIPGAVIGGGKHFVMYYVRNHQLINFVAQQQCNDWLDESWTVKADIDKLKQDYLNWDKDITQLLSHVDNIYCWALYSHQPLATWSKDRVCLLGDACHPSLPNLASGAGMAIEDAYILADCLALHSYQYQHAFEQFFKLRIKRCSAIQKRSERMAKLFHARHPLEQQLKQLPLRLINRFHPQLAQRAMAWIHEYDATQQVT